MKISSWPELDTAIVQTIRNRLEVPQKMTVEYEVYKRDDWHLYDFLYCNYKTIFRKRNESPPISDDQAVLFWTGHAFQYFLTIGHKPKVYQLDDIYLSPDIEDYTFGDIFVPLGELKTTRSNMKWFKPENNNQYLEQIMGYLKAGDKTWGALIVMFLMADYAPPFPKLRSWRCEFTQKELDDKWFEILLRKNVLESALKSGKYPDTHYMAFEAECKRCENEKICPKYKK